MPYDAAANAASAAPNGRAPATEPSAARAVRVAQLDASTSRR